MSPRSHRAHSSPRRRRGWLASAMALALLVGQLAGTLHQVTVAHEVCAHGHLVHSHEVHSDGRADRASQAPADVTLAPTVGAEAPPHAHEHCELCVTQREIPTLEHRTTSVRGPPAAERAVELVPASLEAPGGVPVLAQAPKTSPPV